MQLQNQITDVSFYCSKIQRDVFKFATLVLSNISLFLLRQSF